jgi:hypothetical protein
MRKYCKSTADIPKTEHYAIVENRSVFIPGDQRSIDFPGHGYPASTEHFLEYVAYTEKEEWEAEIKKRLTATYGDKNFLALKVTPAEIKTSFEVNIS